jgi:hypothetical protein
LKSEEATGEGVNSREEAEAAKVEEAIFKEEVKLAELSQIGITLLMNGQSCL